jgi:Holliday junction resolvase RusA-like endonuclease
VITFQVDGQPVPQGSLKVINGRVIHAKGSELAAWRSAIALRAREAGAKPHIEPVEIEMIFTMARPKTVTRPEPSVAPDLDKLVRAVLDGLTAIAYRDDGQVVRLTATKEYGSNPGLWVQMWAKMPA